MILNLLPLCFNPLHCGAVVASYGRGEGPPGSPPPFQSPSLRGSGRFRSPRCPCALSSRFNPLHCGAVVASSPAARLKELESRVSIPFIAGQWSLQPDLQGVRLALAWFQSPSLRGSGRFLLNARSPHGGWASFNPLHCGAVVASRPQQLSLQLRSPVSIPFIAGQWSLLLAFTPGGSRGTGFNPLHCGAVVASDAPETPDAPPPCFNPLHCGAVVASNCVRR